MLFNSNHNIRFRQKLVILLGFQIALILLANVYCANETASEIIYEMEMNEMADHFISKAKMEERLASEDLRRCCSARDPLDTGFDADYLDNKRINPAQIWFMEPSDIIRANMDRKFKEGKYLLFIDNDGKVFAFDLTLPGYDTEEIKAQVKEFLRD